MVDDLLDRLPIFNYKFGMLNKDMNRLNVLFEVAKELPGVGGAKVAAALYVKNELVAVGWNQERTSPFAAKYGRNSLAICLHGETHAIKQALRTYSVDDLARAKTTLYVCRAKRTGIGGEFIWGLSKPCMGCLRSIVDFGIKRVVYSMDEIDNERTYGELP